MATFTGNGTGSNMYGYMHARVVVTRTDNSDGTTCSVSVAGYAVSDGGSSSFISGRVSNNEACTTWSSYSSEKSVGSGSVVSMTSASLPTVNRTKTAKTITCKAQIKGGGTGMYNGLTDTASVSVTIPALASYTVSYNANIPSGVSDSAQGMPAAQTKYHGTGLALSTNQPSLVNYIFKGWAESASGSVLIQPGASYTYTGNANKTYYAKWELAYRKPEISNLTVFRTLTSTGTAKNDEGEYARVSFSWTQDSSISGTNAPTITVKAKVKGSSDDYTTCKTGTSTTGTSGTYAASMGFGSGIFAKTSSYDVEITIVDNRSSKPSGNDGKTVVNYTLPQAYFMLDFSSSGGIGIGIAARDSKNFDVAINENIISTNITDNIAPASETSGNNRLYFTDGALNTLGYVSPHFTDAGNQYMCTTCSRKIDDTTYTHDLSIGLDDSGDKIVSLSKEPWLSALGIEFGYSNVTGGRWDWVKLPNGLAICNYCDSEIRTVACTSQTGSMYWGQVWTQSGSPSFPITFIETPTLSASPSGSNNYFVQTSHGDHTTGKVGDVYLCRSSSTTFNGKMHITAIGRWK